MAKTKRVDPPHVETPSAPNPGLDAVGITAIAKSQKPDNHRNLLQPGFHQVDLSVKGSIDGQAWGRNIVGTLTIAPDSAPVATSSTPWADLLQSALCWLSAKERQTWLATVAAGEIPPTACSPEKAAVVSAEMEPALKSYRATKQAPKRGNVAFVPTIPPKP